MCVGVYGCVLCVCLSISICLQVCVSGDVLPTYLMIIMDKVKLFNFGRLPLLRAVGVPFYLWLGGISLGKIKDSTMKI